MVVDRVVTLLSPSPVAIFCLSILSKIFGAAFSNVVGAHPKGARYVLIKNGVNRPHNNEIGTKNPFNMTYHQKFILT